VPKSNMIGRFDDPTIIEDEFKKIYLCGCQNKAFETTTALSMHIRKEHNGFPPEGTLYGVSRRQVIKQFQPIEEKQPVMRPLIEKTEFVCGCGLSYTRLSSLRHHIRTNHDGEPSFNTIGLKGAYCDREEDLPNDTQELSDSRSSTNNNKEERV
jgi:hypothetical protein